MKRLDQSQLVALASTDQIAAGERLLGKKFELNPGAIQDGLNAGHYQQALVQVGGVDRYLVVYHVTHQRTLFINYAVELVQGEPSLPLLIEALKTLAKQNNCESIETITMRAGLLKGLLESGFNAVGVTVALKL